MENASPELLVRWYQYGALTPFCRNHNHQGQNDQYPWVLEEAGEAICRHAVEWRYRLLPYLYAAFVEASENGAPLQRPLVFDAQADLSVRSLDDQFLLGRDLLVAPVYREGQTARTVYLPAGTWYDQDDLCHEGPAWITAAAPLSTIPHYVRGGIVIPMWPAAPASTMGHQPTSIELHLYPSSHDGEMRSVLHEDDGETFAFREGGFYRTEFTLQSVGDTITLEAVVTGNGYPTFARTEFVLVFHGMLPPKVMLDGREACLVGHRLALRNDGKNFSLLAKRVLTPSAL